MKTDSFTGEGSFKMYYVHVYTYDTKSPPSTGAGWRGSILLGRSVIRQSIRDPRRD